MVLAPIRFPKMLLSYLITLLEPDGGQPHPYYAFLELDGGQPHPY